MRTLLENHEVIIISEYVQFEHYKGLVEGDIIDYKNTVKGCYLYEHIGENQQLIKVYLDKKMILELAEKIKFIETQIEKKPYTNFLPF